MKIKSKFIDFINKNEKITFIIMFILIIISIITFSIQYYRYSQINKIPISKIISNEEINKYKNTSSIKKNVLGKSNDSKNKLLIEYENIKNKVSKTREDSIRIIQIYKQIKGSYEN